MKKRILTVFVIAITAVQFGYSQETKKDPEFGVKWGGYVKADYIYDTRHTDAAREGNFFVYPSPENIVGGKDINDEANFNGYAIESRLAATISGPDFFGMKTSGLIEGHFFGANNADINGFSLRHAYIQLSNDKLDILVGQYWHPTFVTNVSPGTYGFNAGVPFQAFNRSPQIRISTKGKVRFIGVLLTERDFKTGGAASARYAALPAVHAQLQFGSDSNVLGGFGVNVKTVDTNPGYNDDLTSVSFLAYVKAQLSDKVTWKLQGLYGGNMTELLQAGGYGLDKNNDPIANKTLSVWSEFSGDFSESLEWGLFGGYSVDNGYGEQVTVLYNTPVESSYRIAPRIGWKSGKVKLGVELDYSNAQYGAINPITGDFVTSGIKDVGNFRTALSLKYGF